MYTYIKNYTNSVNSRVVCQEWNSDTYKNVHSSNIDIISTSKQKKQQAALQSSWMYNTVVVRVLHSDWNELVHNMKTSQRRHNETLTDNPRSSNIQRSIILWIKSVIYWQIDVLQAQENTSVTALRHGRYLPSAHTQNDGWCQEHRKQQNSLSLFFFFSCSYFKKETQRELGPPVTISKHIWSSMSVTLC